MDVGIDNAFALLGEWRPFSLDEILAILKIGRCEICNGIDPRHLRGCPEQQNVVCNKTVPCSDEECPDCRH